MLRILMMLLLLPLWLWSQERGERFWLGSVSYSTSTTTNTSINNSTGTFRTDFTTSYYGELRLSRGKFISNNRSFSYGILGSLNYSETDYTKVNGNNQRNTNTQLGALIGLGKYYNVLPGLYATLNHDFSFLYAWNGSNDSKSVKTNSQVLSYRFAPGLMYRIKPTFALQLNLTLLNVNVGRTAYRNPQNQQTRQNINLNFLSGTTLGNVSFSVLYFPFQPTRKQNR